MYNAKYTTKTLNRNKKLRKARIYMFLAFILICIVYFIHCSFEPVIDTNKIKSVIPTQAEQKFIDSLVEPSKEAYKEAGIFPSVSIAQAMLESDAGTSVLARKAENLFGIKAFDWTGPTITMPTQEEYNGICVTVMTTFRVYSSWNDSIKDYTKFLKENRTYRDNGVFRAKNFKQQAIALQKSGYATDTKYASKLITKIIQYRLYKYD